MDLRFSEKEEAFRKEVREFIFRELPLGWSGEPPGSARDWGLQRRFTRKLGEKGWLGLSWPREYGGQEASPIEEAILYEEIAYHRAPAEAMLVIGVGIVGPTIILYGSPEQRRGHLPGITRGQVFWCQCFSEPGSGSDLASLQTRAVEDGDDFIISGQKTFISIAHLADWCYMIARTDPDAPKHKGLSYFLVNMKSPGITVRPLKSMTGFHHINDVFFDDVRVPKDSLLGEKNRGWYMAVTTLDFERFSLSATAGYARRSLDEMIEYVKEVERKGKPLAKDPSIRQRLVEMAVETEILRLLNYRVLWMHSQKVIPNYEASMAKLYSSELTQRLAHVGMQILGLYGQLASGSSWAPLDGAISGACLHSVSATIQGGTSEIQRSIIAVRGLGLPRG